MSLRALSKCDYLLVSNGPFKRNNDHYFRPQINIALRLKLDDPQGIFDFPGETVVSIGRTLKGLSFIYVIDDESQWKIGFVLA